MRIFLGGVPRSLVSEIKGKAEVPDAAYANLRSPEETFAKLRESTVADIKLLRFISSVMIALSLMMI